MKLPIDIKLVTGDFGRGLATETERKESEFVFSEKPIISCAVRIKDDMNSCSNCQCSMVPISNVSLPLYIRKQHSQLWSFDESKSTICDCCGTRYCSSNCMNEAMARYHKVECQIVTAVRDLRSSIEEIEKNNPNVSYSAAILLSLYMTMNCAQAGEKDLYASYSSQVPRNFSKNFLLFKSCVDDFIQAASKVYDPFEKVFNSNLLIALTNSITFASSPKHLLFSKISKIEGGDVELSLMTSSERGELEGLCSGVGIYATSSLVNHSCSPNCTVNPIATHNHTLHLNCISEMEPGSQLTINYLYPNCGVTNNPKIIFKEHRSLLQRREKLKRAWSFDCECSLCSGQECAIEKLIKMLENDKQSCQNSNENTYQDPSIETATEENIEEVFDKAAESEPLSDSLDVFLHLSNIHNHQGATHMAGCIYYYPDCGKVDLIKAEKLLRKASILNDGKTLNSPLSWCTLSELLTDINGSSELISELLHVSALQGNPTAQLHLALHYTSVSMKTAWQWIEVAVEQGVIQALYTAGSWARTGKGLSEPDLKLAKSMLETAAKHGYPVPEKELNSVREK